jgi:hypothetical protein
MESWQEKTVYIQYKCSFFFLKLFCISLCFPLVISNFKDCVMVFDLFWIDLYTVRHRNLVLVMYMWISTYPKHHWLKRLSFSPRYVLSTFVKNLTAVMAWVYFWVYYSIGLCVVFATMPLSIMWNKIALWSVVVAPALLSFLRFIWLCRVICASMWIFFFLVLRRISLEFWWGLNFVDRSL